MGFIPAVARVFLADRHFFVSVDNEEDGQSVHTLGAE